MKNLKKVLALVMACAMLFTMSSFAFTDVAEDASYLEAVTMLSKLGIINGYEDGTFLPDNTITRAEMAKILVASLNAAEQADGMKEDNIFTDVPASHWAAGYINYAANVGIINGRGNGIYDPEAPVTYEEAVKLIVAMLGYTPVANVKGGYPTGYLYVANQMIKITKGATGVTGDAAKRWVVARLLYNSLEARMMEQETWSAADPEFIKGNDTLLDDYLEITKLEAVVTETFYQNFNDKDDTMVDFIVYKVNGVKQYITTYEIVNEDEEDEHIVEHVVYGYHDTIEAAGSGAEDYLGYTVTVYVRNFDEGNEEVVAISPKAGKNATLTVALTDFNVDEASDNIESPVGKNYITFEYYADGDDAEKAKVLQDGVVTFFINDMPATADDDTLEETIEAAGELYEGDDAYITFLDNDADGVYDYAFLETITDEVVVEEIVKKNYKVVDKKGGSVKLSPEKDDEYVAFYKDGKAAEFSDIAEGDVLTIVEGGNNDKVKKVYISSEKVEGYVSSQSERGYKINGNLYKQSSFFEETIERKDSGTFYINVNGKIAYVENDAEVGGNYAFLLDVNTESSFSSGVSYVLRFLNAKGEWIDAPLAETVTYTIWSEEEERMVSDKMSDFDDMATEEPGESLEDLTGGWLTAEENEDEIVEIALGTARANRVFQYTLNSNGEVSKIVVAADRDIIDENNFSYVEIGNNNDEITGDEYDALGNRFKGTSLKGGVDKNTVVFNVDLIMADDNEYDRVDEDQTIESDLKKKQVTIADYTMFEDEEVYTGYAYDFANDAYKCMVIDNASTSVDVEARFLVVKSLEITSNEDEESYVIIEGLMNGDEVTLESIADEDLNSAIDVTFLDGTVMGDVEDEVDGLYAYVDGAAVFEVALDANNKITDIKIIYAPAMDEEASWTEAIYDRDEEEIGAYVFGLIGTSKISGTSSAKFIELVDAAGDPVAEVATAGSLMKGDIYAVDLTTRRPKYDIADSILDFVGTIELDDEGELIMDFEDEQELAFALAKVVDDEVIDIVTYTIEYVEA